MKSSRSFFNEFDYYITPSEIIEFSYCNRFTYFMKCLGINQHEEKRFKVQQGRTVHEERANQNRSYLRKSIGAVKKMIDVELVSKKYGIRGKIDEVCFLKDDSVVVLDYKFAKYEEKIYETYKNQMVLYAIMVEEVFEKACNKAYLVYCREENKLVEIEISCHDKDYITAEIAEFLEVLKGKYPLPTKFRTRCLDCCYRNICIK